MRLRHVVAVVLGVCAWPGATAYAADLNDLLAPLGTSPGALVTRMGTAPTGALGSPSAGGAQTPVTTGSSTALPTPPETTPTVPVDPAQPVQPADPQPVVPPITGRRCSTKRQTTTCITFDRGRMTKRCVTGPKVRACVWFNKTGVATRRCITPSGKRTRCASLVGRRPVTLTPTVPAVRSPKGGTLTWWGWPAVTIAVGKIYNSEGVQCSGTMVTRSLMLTAGHCISSRIGTTAQSAYTRGIVFVPGQGADGANPNMSRPRTGPGPQ